MRRLAPARCCGAVNTHEHFDHTFGNGVFRAPTAPSSITPTRPPPRPLPEHARRGPRHGGAARTTRAATRCSRPRSSPADRTFSSAVALDLGDRLVELVHPGRGHTGGDLVVRVPDADVLLAGDLVEESDGGSVPAFGDDCYPDGVAAHPRHRARADHAGVGRRARPRRRRSTATSSRSSATRSASSPRRSATSPPAASRSTRRWPPPSGPTRARRSPHAVRRGYEHLPRSQKRLPLV